MSDLTIVDLPQAEDLSSSGMAKVTGGSCNNALIASQVYTVIGDVFLRGGDTQHASYYYGKAAGTTEGGCPA